MQEENMSEKKRVYELASELGMAAKELLALLIKEGYDVKTTSSSLPKSDADLVFSQVMADSKKKE
ncbi:MAG: translation initiation factor IF-2 N-terminal domain-containing protein, partial [Victivallales bacterium]|nr:translation initiation factor IF-2 N-terminal domain-containing protein [Victivallales bacterium]